MRVAVAKPAAKARVDIANRVEAVDWSQVSADLDTQGWAMMTNLLGPEECDAIAELYGNEAAFRSRIVMARHGFGQGEYKYFGYPLPVIVAKLRSSLYPHLAPIANRWHEVMGLETRFPG